MALEGIELNAGTGGETVATDRVGGLDYQVVKLATGADGTADLVGNSAPLPVSDAGGTLTVDGTVELGATSLAALETIELGATSLAALESLTTISTVTTVSAVTAITNALPAGDNNIGNVDIASALPAGTNAIGTVTAVGAAAEDAAVSGNPVLVGGRYDSSARTLETGDAGAIALNASGQVLVEIAAGAGSGGTSAADGATFTRNTTSITPAGAVVESSAPTLTNGDVAGLSQTTGGALRVAVASGGVAGIVDDAAFTPGTTEGVVFMAHADETSADAVDEGDAGALRMTLSRGLHTTIRCADGATAMDESNDAVRVNVVAGAVGTTQYTEDTAAAGGEALCLMGAIRRDTANSEVSAAGDYSPLLTDANGRLYVIASFTASQNIATIGTSITPGTSAAHLGKAEDTAHASGDTGVAVWAVRSDTLAAASGTTGDYEPFHTDSNGALWTRNSDGLADDAAFTPGTSRVHPIGLQADETATDSVDEGDIGAPRMTLDRKQIVANYAHAAGGGSSYSAISTAAVLTAEIKGSAGKVYSLQVFNLNAAARYVRLYNQTGAPASTDGANVVWRGLVPGDTAGAGFVVQFPMGKQFTTGIGIRASAAIADNDTTALAANELLFNVDYA